MGYINKAFFHIGYYSASHPGTVCFLAVMMTAVCSLGFLNYRVTVKITHKFNIANFIEQSPRIVGSQRF
jgi:hypothetical protein